MTFSPDLTPFRNVLYEALAGDGPSIRDADPLLLLNRLTDSAERIAELPSTASSLVEDLALVAKETQLEAAIAAAAARFDSPQRFAEAIYFARCLTRDAEPALSLLNARTYLEDAVVPDALPELQTDRAAVLDAATFASLWHDPARLDWMLHTTSLWRRDYVSGYTQRHASYAEGLSGVAKIVRDGTQQASTLSRLNGLTRLGAPVGLEALSAFRTLEMVSTCNLTPAEVSGAMEQAPSCTGCGYRLGDEAPHNEARRVRGEIERGLAVQQSRLASRVVSQLLTRPTTEDRLDRFVKVVQASDLAGLALVLDDSLVDFLRELLESDNTVPGLLGSLADSYPEVTPANLDAAVAEFRKLLEAEIGRGGSARLDVP